jgi:hypothetical protein
MPLITGFRKLETKTGSLQPTQVEASYKVFERDGFGPVFQIGTGGSEHRKYPGKGSQTFQLDPKAAEALWTLLGSTYGFR